MLNTPHPSLMLLKLKLVYQATITFTEVVYPVCVAAADVCVSAEKGLCVSSVWLWVLLVYTEASLRLKDLKSSHTNLSQLFAAHW